MTKYNGITIKLPRSFIVRGIKKNKRSAILNLMDCSNNNISLLKLNGKIYKKNSTIVFLIIPGDKINISYNINGEVDEIQLNQDGYTK